MAKYIVIYNREECIGAGACATMVERFWEMDDDNKANLIGGKINDSTGFYELEIEEKDLEEALESARVCPVEVIEVHKIEENGERTKINLDQ